MQDLAGSKDSSSKVIFIGAFLNAISLFRGGKHSIHMFSCHCTSLMMKSLLSKILILLMKSCLIWQNNNSFFIKTDCCFSFGASVPVRIFLLINTKKWNYLFTTVYLIKAVDENFNTLEITCSYLSYWDFTYQIYTDVTQTERYSATWKISQLLSVTPWIGKQSCFSLFSGLNRYVKYFFIKYW